ncbi:MAG: HlyC/CorC family transporter [Halieaceae bacterium]|uniref:HlyC/CorC family transporter n=1 Tax=Candidatus Seongchinamella marina TaxID=2518990 RepID=A0ABT3SRX7_9GAMM|nr:HlyC/CorC family transporter [Candidatus Seongchinamella marina]MBT3411546.1 HlyC/CorC family transporter [Halieaceae bacterium]MBT7720243.1 HlyC/CorC family transporter [Halieaceae bacterium]MCX2972744.1 HlyC/CorC family transporter [Candidatus Seongchinamella marina]
MNEAPLGLLFSVLAALVLLSGFFSSSETGMMSLNRYRLKHLQNNKHRGATRAGKLLERPDRLIGLILIGNNLVNIFASAIATVIAIRLWGDAGIFIATFALTLVILIFAEITPKTIAALHPEKIAFPASLILLPLLKILYPLVAAVNWITNGLLRTFGMDPAKQNDEHVSSDELRTIVTDAGKLIPARHRGMLLNILDLEEVSVDDIMVPRNDVFGIDLDDSDDEILRYIQTSSHTRLPVWKEDINNIVGMLHMRNMSRVIDSQGLDRNALEREMEKPYFIPEGTPLHTQLLNFQQKKSRLAVVVDEYGEVMGLVALEDILEEIVGEFTSNMAGTEDNIFPQRDGSFIIAGTANIREINKSLDWHLPTDGPKTISGLILEYLEGFPDANAGLSIDTYRLEILELEGNVVQAVKANVVAAEPTN